MLVVVETFTKRLWGVRSERAGKGVGKRIFATLSGDHRGARTGLTSITKAICWPPTWGGSAIEIFDEHGLPLEKIITPFARPSNIHLGGCSSLSGRHHRAEAERFAFAARRRNWKETT